MDVETKLGSAGHEEDDNGFMWVANNTCCIRHSNEGTGENRPQVCVWTSCHLLGMGWQKRGADIPGGITTGSKAGMWELVLPA